ncbi:MAG: adenosylcobinamide-GDP ribazoletransferase [Methyloligellaceae bacterium]
MIRELHCAVMFLTRIPFIGLWTNDIPLARSVWAFSVVGVVVGLWGFAIFSLCQFLGFSDILSVMLAVGSQILITGALHEDGAADFIDGFGAGRDRARRLEIMADSRIGTYGVIGLILLIMLRVSALHELIQIELGLAAFIATATLSRANCIVIALINSPARLSGLGVALKDLSLVRAVIGLILAQFVAVILFDPITGGLLSAMAILVSVFMAAWAFQKIGGYTGDVFGACQVFTEITLLLFLTLWF